MARFDMERFSLNRIACADCTNSVPLAAVDVVCKLVAGINIKLLDLCLPHDNGLGDDHSDVSAVAVKYRHE